MNILFITAHPYLPQMYGGLQTSTDQLSRSLLDRGHRITVLSALMPGKLFGSISRLKMQINKILNGIKFSINKMNGYKVYCTWFPAEIVQYVAKRENSDLIVVLAVQSVAMALAAKTTGLPIILLLQDVEFTQHGGTFEDIADLPCIANSQFTARMYYDRFGVNSKVIYPFINSENVKVESSRENVTFINPVAVKGKDNAILIAKACPEIPFVFVEGWPLSSEERKELGNRIKETPNVKLIPPQRNMKNVYDKCKILLVPSLWDEAYGMVVTEAQLNGIPIIASKRGGLPEAVGPGGSLIDPASSTEDWIKEVRKLWTDQTYYLDKSRAALSHSNRLELNLKNQVDAYEAEFKVLSYST